MVADNGIIGQLVRCRGLLTYGEVIEAFFLLDQTQRVADGRIIRVALFGLGGQIECLVQIPFLVGQQIGQDVGGRDNVRFDLEGGPVVFFPQGPDLL